MDNSELNSPQDNIKNDEHLYTLKRQLNINFDENYNYLPSKTRRFFNKILVAFACPVFSIINFFALGLKVKGKKNLKMMKKQKISYINVSNHCMFLDCSFSIIQNFPRTVYIPTVEPTMRMPYIRHVNKSFNVVPIPTNIKGLVKFKNSINQLLNQPNNCVLLYPEGSLWPRYPGIRQFKTGAFRFAVDNEVPIVPSCIYFRKRTGLWRLIGKKALATVEFLPPVFHDKTLSKKIAIEELSNRTHQIMKEVIDNHYFHNPYYDEMDKQLTEESAC